MSYEHTRDPDFWQQRYAESNTPWDLGGPHPTLAHVVELGLLRGRDHVLVPGCGNGHDVLALARSGHIATGVDFAAGAIAALDEAARAAGLDKRVTARQANLFDLGDDPAASVDAVFEYTCFCAIDPKTRTTYRDVMTHLVRPGGRMIWLVFPIRPPSDDGPPHAVQPAEVRDLFADGWEVVLETEPRSTPEPRQGKERLLILERVQ